MAQGVDCDSFMKKRGEEDVFLLVMSAKMCIFAIVHAPRRWVVVYW
jgi:hypothetical protein